MLPNFFVIGAPRSGTTSLYEYLSAHPDIFMSTVKEPDFFARPSLDEVDPVSSDSTERSLADDAAGRDPLSSELAEYESLFTRRKDENRIGEASALYLGHQTAAWHIRSYVPDAPFVVVLRDPVARAHSHWVHAKRIYADHGRTSAIGAEDRSIDEEFARAVHTASTDGMPTGTMSEPEIWVRSGFYKSHLLRWFELFPREQFAIFLYEDLAEDANALMRQVFEHLGVDDSFELPTTETFNASVVPRNQRLFSAFTTANPAMRRAKSLAPPRVRAFATSSRNRLLGGSKPEIQDDLRSRLRSIYRDDTEALQELIGRDLSGWMPSS